MHEVTSLLRSIQSNHLPSPAGGFFAVKVSLFNNSETHKMSVTIFIGEDLYAKLPEDEQETFDLHERYKPDAIGEQIQNAAAEDEEWSDEAFSDLDDYQTFWGGDFSEVGGHVYKKEIDNMSEDEMERFESLSEEVQEMELGTQLRFQ